MNVDVTMPPERPAADGRLHAGDEILGRYVVQSELGQGGMGNVMVDSDGHVQILDFGLAARIHTSMSRISLRSTSMSGTPRYKSPEQLTILYIPR